MAILRIIRHPMLTRESYEAIDGRLNVAAHHPLGLILHSAGEVEGAWQLVEVWDSEEYARSFDVERLEPVIRGLFGGTPPAAEAVSYELHNLVTP